jgi:predicted phosphoribosyltransferase
MKFKNRVETARLRAEKLKSLRDKNPIVLGVSPGAMPMARSIIGDEIATHSIMMGAIHEVRMGKPAKVIVAAVVASEEAPDPPLDQAQS